jgi:hypothetical protein
MNIQDHSQRQFMLEWNHCGRFKTWQLALLVIGAMCILAGGAPLLCDWVSSL